MTTRFRHGWSCTLDDWTKLADILANRPWRSAPFIREWARNIPCHPGVYVIRGSPPVRGIFSKAWCPIYAGETLDLRSRFLDHVRGRTHASAFFSVFVDKKFYYLRLSDSDTDTGRSSRLQYEQILQVAFGPVANKRYAIRVKVGDPVPV